MDGPNGNHFKDKIARLSAAIEEGTRKISIKDQCFPMVVGLGAVVPFATMLVFFLWRPSFVRKNEGSKNTISVKKLFWVSILSTLFIWATMYVVNMYRGFDKMALACVV